MAREGELGSGCVHFVGAGPGDPELLTLKAARLLSEADVVVYDRLVSPEILDRVPRGTTRLYVGKMSGCHPVPQDQINELLVDLAATGKRVVRLKGGDPFVFGRGSEEAAHLARAGIAFTVVPGITSASGCGAAFGIPLTHRGVATGVRYITGHCRDDEDLDLDWRGLADPHTTLVVYLGSANLPIICARLIAAGMPSDTPCAAIAEGTTPRQRICNATLENVASQIVAEGLGSPLLVIVGAVVAFGQRLADLVVVDHLAEKRHAPRLVAG